MYVCHGPRLGGMRRGHHCICRLRLRADGAPSLEECREGVPGQHALELLKVRLQELEERAKGAKWCVGVPATVRAAVPRSDEELVRHRRHIEDVRDLAVLPVARMRLLDVVGQVKDAPVRLA